MRILLDVSTSLAWRRPSVGIVRTEQKFAGFVLGQQGVDVGFCRYDRQRGRHVVVPHELVERRLRRLDDRDSDDLPAGAPSQAAPASARVPARGVRWLGRRARSLARKPRERLPPHLRPEAALVAQATSQLLKSVYWLGRKAWRGVALRDGGRPPRSGARARSTGDGDLELRPRVDDVYVSMGLDWEYNDLVALYHLKRLCGFRTLLYCYDLIPIRFPHFMTFDARDFYSDYFLRLALLADHVVAISEASRDDYRSFLVQLAVPVPPMSVIHLGTDVAAAETGQGSPPREDLTATPFVLCVGTIEARKNHELLYHLWDRLVASHGERVPLLVLVGLVGWGVQDLLAHLRVNRRVADRIVILEDVPDDALLWLYEHCLFTVFPSFAEGLGLPVVESLALGTPCIASSAPSVVEAARGFAPTLDPLDFPRWYATVERYIFDGDVRREAAQRLRGYRAPSWRCHGEAMLALIRQVADANLHTPSGGGAASRPLAFV